MSLENMRQEKPLGEIIKPYQTIRGAKKYMDIKLMTASFIAFFTYKLRGLNIEKDKMPSEEMLEMIVDYIFQNYGFLSIEEVGYVFSKGVMGYYDDFIHRVDCSVVGSWLKKHALETSGMRQAIARKQAQELERMELKARSERNKEKYEKLVAQGYVPKTITAAELEERLKKIAKGEQEGQNEAPQLIKIIEWRIGKEKATKAYERLKKLWLARKEAKEIWDFGIEKESYIYIMERRLEAILEKKRIEGKK
jgi:hypothetical protein